MARGPRGHSNVRSGDTNEDPSLPGVARIPLGGGTNTKTWRDLPPLALRRYEWETIGRRMGWREDVSPESAVPGDTAPTPGPWRVDRHHVEAGDNLVICNLHYGVGSVESEAEKEANVRLIAAAPRLLRAVQLFLDLPDIPDIRSHDDDTHEGYDGPHGYTSNCAVCVARRAVQQAGGRSTIPAEGDDRSPFDKLDDILQEHAEEMVGEDLELGLVSMLADLFQICAEHELDYSDAVQRAVDEHRKLDGCGEYNSRPSRYPWAGRGPLPLDARRMTY